MKRDLKRGILTAIRKSFVTKVIAMMMALFTLFDVVYPTMSWALTGGPSQPEVSGFAPIDTSDMVNLFTGDFNYNIPLMDMDGYPLNLAYNGGAGMDEEASWVGLGWSLNPGVVNRNMRGLPDDFNGTEAVVKEYNLKPNRVFGIDAGVGGELFGLDNLSGSIDYTLGLSFSNYYGVGVKQSIGVNFEAQLGPLNASLGINSSSENGLTLSPNVGMGLMLAESKDKKSSTSLGFGVGTSYNTRAGVKQLSVNAGISKSYEDKHAFSKSLGSLMSASGSFDLGMPTYTPTVSMNMHNVSIAGNFQAGGELFGLHLSGHIGGYYNGQKLQSNSRTNPAYGYFHLKQGQLNQEALLDFNRENDGEFTTNTPHLPQTSLTYDLYAVSGQGIGGSYRAFRSEIGHVFDPYTVSTSEGYDVGAEIGAGNLIHGGGTISVNNNNTSSGKWNNPASQTLRYGKNNGSTDFEEVYFKEANEKSVESDDTYFQKFGGDQAVRFKLDKSVDYNVTLKKEFLKDDGSTLTVPADNYRAKRDKRNQVIQVLSRKEQVQGAGLNAVHTSSYAAPDHHVAEINTYGTNGMRYVYGLAAYNKFQKDVSFAVGDPLYGGSGLSGDCNSGLVTYPGGTASASNAYGLDNFYSSVTTPAYAHSYFLTAVLSPDYVDADDVKGPSIGDLGYYTKFDYKKVHSNYKWRVPVGANKANFDEGLKTDPNDDKGSYLYGEKEIWYISRIESKNYIAVFKTEPRKDALGVNGPDGGADTSEVSHLLRKISFYSRHDYFLGNGSVNPNAVPIKEVHFEYNYSLCPGVENNNPAVPLTNPNETGTGKLTLTKVYFTYQNSKKAKFSPYSFTYGNNPSYNQKSYDRWGNYKSNSGNCSISGALNNAEFPYAEQDTATAKNNASSWALTEIRLPSGGKIEIEYESDDYAYVQNKKAMQMFTFVGYCNADGSSPVMATNADLGSTNKDKALMFALDPGANTAGDIEKYFEGIGEVYFRSLVQIIPGHYDYVYGYAQVGAHGTVDVSGTTYGYIKFNTVPFRDGGGDQTNPIVKAGIQFARIHLQRFIYENPNISDSDGFGEDLVNQLLGSSLLSDLVNNTTEFLKGPNKFLYDNKNVAEDIRLNKTWVRLNNPDGHKLGGGARVCKIKMHDSWGTMTGDSDQNFYYGQEYFYDVNGDGTGISSGVAAYEPQIGGEENPWKQAIAYSIENKLAPDDKMYQQTPLGESFFPSPNVGYGKVTVRNLRRLGDAEQQIVTKHATGKTVQEFYTAKDFPTIVRMTDRDMERDKTNPFSIASIFNISSRDHLAASEGFVIETNDMHGKPKRQLIYQENQPEPITSVEYHYQQEAYGDNAFRLRNNVTAIDAKGNVVNKEVGVFFDMVADMRESSTNGQAFKVNLNIESFIIGPLPPIGPIPILIGSTVSDETKFRSATATKVIQRFGVLEETIAKDLGSVVSTKNMAYDAETGEILLTQTTTDFNDKIYTLVYPAHWYYDGMGQAYKNLDIRLALTTNSSGMASYVNADKTFVPGDELWMDGTTKVWATNVTGTSVTLINASGAPVASGTHNVKIIRSGRKNLQAAGISSITTLTNPLDNFSSNVFSNVLQASAVEYTDEWRTFCDCFTAGGEFANASTNPYFNGTRGNWRTKKSLLHLTSRNQSNYNNNSNIRRDGTFTSYTPYYKLNFGNWQTDEKNWTFTSEVTEFSPFGQELENRDALGRYSAATFGYRQTFATAIAANARYRNIGFDNFEDYGFSPCADNHFKFTNYTSAVTPGSDNKGHTGRRSIKVQSGAEVIMEKAITACADPGCNLSLNSPKKGSLAVVNGVAPYAIEYNVTVGDPVIEVNSAGVTFSTPAGTFYSFELIITDAKGCKITQIVSNL